MSIVNMEKVAVIGLNVQKEKIISALMDVGMVEITQRTGDDKKESKAAPKNEQEKETLSQLDFFCVDDGDEDYVSVIEGEMNRTNIALETLKKYSKEKEPIFFIRRPMTDLELKDAMEKRAEIESDIGQILKLNLKLHTYNERVNKLRGELAAINPWQVYDVDLALEGTKHTSINLGVLPSTVDVEALSTKISQEIGFCSIEEVNRDKDFIYLATIAYKDKEDDLLETLKQYGYNAVPFKGFEGTARDNKGRIKSEIDITLKKIHDVEGEISELTPKQHGIEMLYDYLTMERDRAKIKSRMKMTSKTFNFQGWVPVHGKEAVNKVLDKYDCYYIYSQPEEGDTVPVLVNNGPLTTPFETVMDMYSLPDYNGIDPTNIFSIFYAMFFGIMLSDAGYGILIALGTFLFLKKFKPEGGMQKMAKMFFYCGLSTTFWGAMFGGWFGDLIPVAVKTLLGKTIEIQPLWFNPIEDPTRMLIWSLGFGVVHLFVGMGINAYMLIKRGKWMDAVFDVFSWYAVILGGIMFLVGGMAADIVKTVGMYMALAGAVVLLLTGGRNNKGFGKITGGLGALYNVTGYVSDILSYARLLALGLATGVVATVVNTLGSLGGEGVVSFIVLCLVGIVGHTFNMAINVLGAFVHASRLQYIEFFGKFYEDGGEEFAPFKKDTKYIKILKDNQEEVK